MDVALRASLGLNLLSQLTDEYAQVFGLLHAIRSPDRSKQGPMGDNLSRMPYQINHEVEFFRSEPHVAVANVHRMRVEIDVKNASIDLAAFRWRFFWDST